MPLALVLSGAVTQLSLKAAPGHGSDLSAGATPAAQMKAYMP